MKAVTAHLSLQNMFRPLKSKPVSEWIIAVGRHEGFIPSEQWIEVQELLDAIAEKYNRPHRKTNALLAGLAHCPHCGRRLSVISSSTVGRWKASI